MANCREIETTLASYVDGMAAAPERALVDAHLEVCEACRGRVARERTAHELLCARRDGLRGCAPERLRQRCAAQWAVASGRMVPAARRPRWVPLSLAATLVLAGTLFALFGLGSSVETYAAQLAVDHKKCFTFPLAAASADADVLGRNWHGANGWPLRVAPGARAEQLELLGVRRCASTRGRVAHVLYRWRGQPLSVYVLNRQIEGAAGGSHAGGSDDAHGAPPSHAPHGPQDVVKKFGEQEIIWSDRGRTYAVVARASLADLQHVAGYVRRRIE